MYKAAVIITSIICATILAIVGIINGHDTTLITGSIAAIVGAGSGFAMYYKGRTKEIETQTKTTNGAIIELSQLLYQLFETSIKEEKNEKGEKVG